MKVAELRPELDEFSAVGLRRGAAVPGSTKRGWVCCAVCGGTLTVVAGETPVLTMADARAWSEWLRDQGTQSEGVWLVLPKKGTTDPTTLTYEDALEEALCHGWVDGQLAKGDERTFRRRFTPRRSGGAWSKRNVAIATRLIEEGRMCPAGLVAVEQAKADGRWEGAYAGQATMEVPSDLAAALKASPAANAMFERLSSANRYSVFYRVTTAKRAETRRRRIEQFVAMLARGETIHPQR
ncbi:MAG: YdeI/OmpD-associated family protein [Acidimicrobiales bacterium]